MNILMATMCVAQVSRPGGPLELVERPIPDPGPGSVRIKVQACGVCHSDVFTKEGQWPGITFPRVPGHEMVGVIDAWERTSRSVGSPASASASVGTPGTASPATTAATEQ